MSQQDTSTIREMAAGLPSKMNQAIAAARNRRLVVELLWRRQPLSRRQLAQITGLRESALTYIIRELLQRKVVMLAGKSGTGMGPKHKLLRVNPALGWIVGVALVPHHARTCMMDASGNMLANAGPSIDVSRLEDFPRALKTAVTQWAAGSGYSMDRLLGVGVGVSGTVDPEHGVVLYSNIFRATDMPLQHMIENDFPATTLVDHDAHLAATAEARLGRCKDLENFLLLLINRVATDISSTPVAIGSAMHLSGRAYRGSHFAAGELDDELFGPRVTFRSERDFELLAAADAKLPQHLLDWADRLGKSLSYLSNFIDPAAIVLSGSLSIRNNQYLDRLGKAVRQRLVPIRSGQPIAILPSELGESGVERGAAIAAAEHYLFNRLLA